MYMNCLVIAGTIGAANSTKTIMLGKYKVKGLGKVSSPYIRMI